MNILKLNFLSGQAGFHTGCAIAVTEQPLTEEKIGAIKKRITETFKLHAVNDEKVKNYLSLVKECLKEFDAEIIETPEITILYEKYSSQSGPLGAE